MWQRYMFSKTHLTNRISHVSPNNFSSQKNGHFAYPILHCAQWDLAGPM